MVYLFGKRKPTQQTSPSCVHYLEQVLEGKHVETTLDVVRQKGLMKLRQDLLEGEALTEEIVVLGMKVQRGPYWSYLDA